MKGSYQMGCRPSIWINAFLEALNLSKQPLELAIARPPAEACGEARSRRRRQPKLAGNFQRVGSSIARESYHRVRLLASLRLDQQAVRGGLQRLDRRPPATVRDAIGGQGGDVEDRQGPELIELRGDVAPFVDGVAVQIVRRWRTFGRPLWLGLRQDRPADEIASEKFERGRGRSGHGRF